MRRKKTGIMHPKVLIVGTSPYSTSGTSRTFDAYFHFWEKERIAQVFSRNWVPNKGHCAELFQITDAKLLKRWLHKTEETGTIYHYEELDEQSGIQQLQDTASVGKLYRLGAKHSPLIELLRRVLWKKSYWCTPKFNEWLDRFQPDCVVYSFSNHVFFQQIALYVANRFNIPIVTLIGDDFYFNDQQSWSPTYHIFRRLFKKYTEKILLRKGSSASYCSEKIRAKYNSYFHLNGKAIYTNSTVVRRPFRIINKEKPLIVYFGSIRLGRNNALLDIADALGKINLDYRLEVYSGEQDASLYEMLKAHPNVKYGGLIPYSEVQEKISESDIFVIAEGFAPENIEFTRYSLSTKAADSLASGNAILMYGPEEAGVVGYMKETGAAMVCTKPELIKSYIEELISNRNLQKEMYDKAVEASNNNHLVESTSAAFLAIVEAAVEENRKK